MKLAHQEGVQDLTLTGQLCLDLHYGQQFLDYRDRQINRCNASFFLLSRMLNR